MTGVLAVTAGLVVAVSETAMLVGALVGWLLVVGIVLCLMRAAANGDRIREGR